MEFDQLNTTVEAQFREYTRRFLRGTEEVVHAIELKLHHSFLVRDEAVGIALSEGMPAEDIACASVAGLLHDFGRFEQYRRYRTFADARSENHALLGIQEIEASGIIDDIDVDDAAIIRIAIERHNRAALGDGLTARSATFAKLIRDADKLDIWRLVTEYYERSDPTFRSRAIEAELPDTDEISSAVVEDVLQGHAVPYRHARTLNDFKLMQMGWVYDLNFRHSFQVVRRRNYLERIYDALPQTPILKQVYNQLRNYVASCS
ncbi:MAG: HD domain-containing protein [Chitinivibrionales bacterium]|nr:HD domain-containing protein [Chitinivibrionales bacterium]MBD3358563.1 HD domain-containing protein [Chitinivibrionales bacterium]